MISPANYTRLAWIAALLAFCVVALGAYVRLSDAGLGCPDWPGCYGKLTPHHAAEEIDRALSAQPEGPVSHAKAWKEMVHRYLAAMLGVLIFTLAFLSLRNPALSGGHRGLPLMLAALVVFQGLLGMWTVTLTLRPAIVSAHLLGGMTTFALLVWLALRARTRGRAPAKAPALIVPATLGLVAVALQIALGGWVSSNYAALGCTDFPLCQGSWVPAMDFSNGFDAGREFVQSEAGTLAPMPPLSGEGVTAIHWTHRVGALVVALLAGYAGLRALREPPLRKSGVLLLAALLTQLALGISNVVFSLPLPVAVAHNAFAAALLAGLVMLNFHLRRG